VDQIIFTVTRQEVQARQLEGVIQAKKETPWSSNTIVCFTLRSVLCTIQLVGTAEVLEARKLINE